jgi:crotonobetainyl-CoA:carnitine CoA-transferase CaiB-like acyl-CoA transferase
MALPPIQERGVLEEIDDGAGPLRIPNPAFRFAHSAANVRNKVPALGEDGPGLLQKLLGLGPEAIAALRRSKVLRGVQDESVAAAE